jgi:hypothetical protein
MRTRIAVSCAVLSTFGVATWLSSPDRTTAPIVESRPTDRDPAAQERAEGSALPCDVPLAWRITRVDEEFGITAVEARSAVQEAAWVWEQASTAPLFRHDSIEGFPIRLVFDTRQARARERQRRQAMLDASLADLNTARAQLDLRSDAQARERNRLEGHLHDLNQRIEAHNRDVARLNQGGGVSNDDARAIQTAGEALESERRELEEELLRLNRRLSSIEDDRLRLDQRVREHVRRAEDFARSFPPEGSQWGLYREAIHHDQAESESVSREIRIYRFETRDDLVSVATHELGHALGLEHNAATGAVMSGERDRVGSSLGPTALTPTDVEAFRALCPDLVTDGPAEPP